MNVEINVTIFTLTAFIDDDDLNEYRCVFIF